MSVKAQLSYFVRTAMGSMVRAPFVHVTAVAALALSLVGFGLARIVSAQLDSLMANLAGEVEMTVYLSPQATEEQIRELEQSLVVRTQGTVSHVSSRAALDRLAQVLGEAGDALAKLEDNPLPASLELQLPPSARDPGLLATLAERTRGLSFVMGVDYGAAAIERLSTIARALRLAGLVVFALVFVTAIIVVSATLQLAIFSRREEIEIQKLVGGTDWFVRVPFLIEGVFQGVLAFALAWGVLYSAVHWAQHRGGEILELLGLHGALVASWGGLAGELAGVGSALGLLGSFIAVRRFLNV